MLTKKQVMALASFLTGTCAFILSNSFLIRWSIQTDLTPIGLVCRSHGLPFIRMSKNTPFGPAFIAETKVSMYRF